MFTVTLMLVAIVAKAIGCGVFARLFGFSTEESVRVGVGMISRGEVGLIVAGYGLANGLIGRDVFSASVLMVLATTMVTPPLLRMVFPPHAFVPSTVEETIAGPPEEGEASGMSGTEIEVWVRGCSMYLRIARAAGLAIVLSSLVPTTAFAAISTGEQKRLSEPRRSSPRFGAPKTASRKTCGRRLPVSSSFQI